MADLSVFLFGPPRLEQSGLLVAIDERKAVALLVYLAVSGASHTRDALATLLWPEQSQSSARASLRHALWSLREAGLGKNIAIENDKIRINPHCRLDVFEFNHLLEQHRQHAHAAGETCSLCLTFLVDAFSFYKDDFLAGFTLRDAPQFDEWQYFQREHWKHLFAYALECLVRWHVRTNDWAQAVKYARRWVALDTLHEPAQRWLMRAYAGSGKRSMALKQYAAFTKILDEELGIPPEAETSDIAKTLRSTRPDVRSQKSLGLEEESQKRDRLSAVGESMPSPARFLERETFLEKLSTRLAKAMLGEGSLVFLGAEAGGGKTTLIRHFCAGVPKSVQVSLGICDPLSTPPPLGPLWDIAADMGGDILRFLKDGERPERISRAFLEQLRQEQTIHLVIFEDLHWGDEATLDLLRYIGRRIESTHALVIASYREDEIEGRHPLRTLLGNLATASSIERLHLPALSRQAVNILVAGSTLDPAEAYRRTGGNPFFLTELLAGGTERVPDSVRDAVLVRAARLTQPARSVLDTAAVIGPRIETELIIRVTGAEVDAIEECLSTRMLLPLVNGMEFRHELARQAILEAISPLRLQRLHRQVLDVLKASSTGLADLARLAHHAEGAGDAQGVLEYAPAAARQASNAGAHRQAAAQYERALRFSSSLPGRERAQLLTVYARECSLCDWNDKELKALKEAGQIWREIGDRLKEGDNYGRLASCLYFLGRFAEANQAINTAIEIISEFPPSYELAQAYNQYANLLAFNSEYDAAISMAKKAMQLGEHFKDTHISIRALNVIGVCLTYFGDESGRAKLEESIALARKENDHVGIALGYCNLGRWIGLMYGWDIANQYIAKGIAHCAEYDMDSQKYFLLASQASARLYQGRWSEAEAAAQLILSQQILSADIRFWVLVVLGRVHARRGDLGNFNALDEALEVANKFGILMYLAPVLAARAEAAWLAGKPELIQDEIRSVYDLAVRKHHIWYAGELGFWLWRAGAAFELPDWAMPVFAEQIQGNWAAAAAEWQRRGHPYERAWALVDGDTQARLTALEIFDQLGAAPAAAALRKKLRSQGVPLRQLTTGAA